MYIFPKLLPRFTSKFEESRSELDAFHIEFNFNLNLFPVSNNFMPE